MNDVLVVGAGPAGNNVALKLVSLGYDVTVADWRYQIGDKLCSGIVGKECIRQYPLDPSLILRNARSAQVSTPNGETIEFVRDEVQAYVIDRVAYVASIAERAKQAGATYLLGSRVTELSINDDHCQVQLSGETGGRTIRAKTVVLASGFGSELNTRAGLGKAGDYVTGVQAEVEAPGIEQTTVYVGQSVAPGFFAWLVPTWKDRALIGLLCRQQGLNHLNTLIQRLQVEGKIAKITREPSRWGVPLRPPSKTYGNRIVAVGDVAGQVKPTTGGGIYYALLSSDIAAETLHEAFKCNDFSGSFLSLYERQWKSVLSHELEVGYSARRFFEVLNDDQISCLVSTITSNGLSSELMDSNSVSFDWHSGAIAKLISYPLVGKALALINPLLASMAPHNRSSSPGPLD